jgi:hypothetical protein
LLLYQLLCWLLGLLFGLLLLMAASSAIAA